MVRPLAARYGWRGTWLMTMGVMWLVIGLGVYFDPIAPRPYVFLEQLHPAVIAAGWWLTGIIAIWQGLRGEVEDDSLGHVALYVMPFLRLGSFAVSALVYFTTWALHHNDVIDHVVGWSEAWFAVLIWSLLSVALSVAASWPNPTTPLPYPPAGAGDDV